MTATKAMRGYSTDIRDHKPLIIKLARKYYGRIISAKILGVAFEDVEGECNLAFHIAAQGYDVTRGFTFTALLQISLQHHFNKFAERLMREQFGRESGLDDDELEGRKEGLGMICMSDMRRADSEDPDGPDLIDQTPCELIADAGALLDARRAIEAVISDPTLLPETRAYIGMLTNPGVNFSPLVRQRIKSKSAQIKAEVSARWGIRMHTLGLEEDRGPNQPHLEAVL